MEEPHNPGQTIDSKLYLNSANYLSSVINTLNGLNVPTLKSLYTTKLRAIQIQKNIQLKQEQNYYRCRRCLIKWDVRDLTGNCKLKATKLTKFAKNVLSKNRRGLPFTTYQRNYYKSLMKRFHNNPPNTRLRFNEMVITCKYCNIVNKRTFTNRMKPIIKQKTRHNVATQKKKKSQKKDKFCGLNKDAVLSSVSSASSTSQVHKVAKIPNKPIAILTDIKRGFETAPFISLEKVVRTIKIKPNKNTSDLNKPAPSGKITKKKKKNLDKLGSFLKNSKQNQKTSSNLKDFLKAL